MTSCVLCGWPLNDEHVYNVKCAAANAEAEQIEAEAHKALDAQDQMSPAETERLHEIAREVIALIRFNQRSGPG
jgi:predicted component of type VI protein secretion system